MLRHLICAVLAASLVPVASAQEAILKVVSFTADWCPNCHIFDPRLEEAVRTYNSTLLEWQPLDLTNARFQGRDAAITTWETVKLQMARFGTPRVFEDYALYGYTGMAVVVAADSQEPLFCLAHQRVNEFGQSVPYTVADMVEQFEWAKSRVLSYPAGQRVPEGADCPPPYSQLGSAQ